MDAEPTANFDFLFREYSADRRPLRLERMTTQAGFSGGAVWKADSHAGPMALRRWASGYPRERIPVIHRLQAIACQSGCDFVPEPIASLGGATFLMHDNRCWELSDWRPGRADFHADPSDARLEQTIAALALWHRAMTPANVVENVAVLGDGVTVAAFRDGTTAPSPGLARRAREWKRLYPRIVSASKRSLDDPLDLCGRTIECAKRLSDAMRRWLHDRSDPVSPTVCLRDIHGEHVLFTADRVTGLIDFGAVGLDSPACDLGRLLGSLVPDDLARWRRAIDWYRRSRPLDEHEEDLAWRFDRTGTVIGALHWFEWLILQRRSFFDPAAAYDRWRTLVERLEMWTPADGAEPRTENEMTN